MNLSLHSPANLIRMMRGGLNTRSNFAEALDRDVFHEATFNDLYARVRPEIWINATDLYYRTSFPFLPGMFNALCSDIRPYHVADAVAASMAVPVVFTPTVLQAFPRGCPTLPAPFVEPILVNPSAPRLMRSMAEALRSYRDESRIAYVKLVDGGVTDNFGLSSILVSRAVASTPYGPMTAGDAIRVRRLLFLVVDAGRGPSGAWNRAVEGPSGLDSALAATDAAIDAAARLAADSFLAMLTQWQETIIKHRCSLSPQELRELGGTPPNWKCDDVQFKLDLVTFGHVSPPTRSLVSSIETRLTLSKREVDAAIEAGRQATVDSALVKAFAASLAFDTAK